MSVVTVAVIKQNFFFSFQQTGEPNKCCGASECISLSDKGNVNFILSATLSVLNLNFLSVRKILDKDVLDIQLAGRYSKKEDHCEPNPNNYRLIDFFSLNLLYCYPNNYVLYSLFIADISPGFRHTEISSSLCTGLQGQER
jgi:hypothetical protein